MIKYLIYIITYKKINILMGVEALNQRQQYGNIYQNQNEFNNFFVSTFDKYDRNRDGKLDRT